MAPNRNDPCPCGSGKKYKHCCMAKDKQSQLDKLLWERAYRGLRTDLIEFAREEDFIAPVAEGLKLFWGDWFVPQVLEAMDEDEALIFFDWFVFDYKWGDDGQRLIDRYADSDPDWLDEKGRELLAAWIVTPPGSAYRKVSADDDGILHLEDIFADRLPEDAPPEYAVMAPTAAGVLEEGEIILARPVPAGPVLRLSGSTVRLPASTEEDLKAAIAEGEKAYLEENPDATWLDFMRDRAYLFPHFAMRNAEEEGRPATTFSEGADQEQGPQSNRPVLPGRKQRRIGRG